MTMGERIFWRVLVADLMLAVLWLMLGGMLLEAIFMAVLQGGLLMMIEGVIWTVHQLMEEIRERRMRHEVQTGRRRYSPEGQGEGRQTSQERADIFLWDTDQTSVGGARPVGGRTTRGRR